MGHLSILDMLKVEPQTKELGEAFQPNANSVVAESYHVIICQDLLCFL